MANCADCVHIKVCQKTRIMNPAYNSAEKCLEYKDRSRFVELPCKIGDTLYFPYRLCRIERNVIDEWIVTGIYLVNHHVGNFFDKNGNWLLDNKNNQIEIQLTLSDKSEFKGCSPNVIWITREDLGWKFFYSRKEAESALKEHKNEERGGQDG